MWAYTAAVRRELREEEEAAYAAAARRAEEEATYGTAAQLAEEKARYYALWDLYIPAAEYARLQGMPPPPMPEEPLHMKHERTDRNHANAVEYHRAKAEGRPTHGFHPRPK